MTIEQKWLPYEIRWARKEEWSAVVKMVWRTFMKFEGREYSKEGIRNFFYFLTGEELYTLFIRGEYHLMVALDGGTIIGAGSVRDKNRLSLLFVDEAYHRRGVGSTILRRLCEYLKTERGERYMSLQAAPYAVNFYRKQGFRAVRPEMEYGGIRVTPMEKIF